MRNDNLLAISSINSNNTYFVDTGLLSPNTSNLPTGETMGFVTYLRYLSDANETYNYVLLRSLTTGKQYYNIRYTQNGTVKGWTGWNEL